MTASRWVTGLASAAAAVALAGCGAAHGTSSPAAHPAAARATPAAVPCSQQYAAWKQASAPGAKKLEAALRRVESASSAEDLPAMASALHRAGAVAAAQRPMPQCADPRGLYARLLARITAAGDNAKDGTGLGALMLAEAPLQGVPQIEDSLTAELKRTVGAES